MLVKLTTGCRLLRKPFQDGQQIFHEDSRKISFMDYIYRRLWKILLACSCRNGHHIIVGFLHGEFLHQRWNQSWSSNVSHNCSSLTDWPLYSYFWSEAFVLEGFTHFNLYHCGCHLLGLSGVNFTNILLAALLYESYMRSLYLYFCIISLYVWVQILLFCFSL